jgi:hypothetical protein
MDAVTYGHGFFWRTGDMLQAIIVFAGVQLAFGIRGFAVINLAFVAIWIVLVIRIASEHRKLTASEAAERAAKPVRLLRF